MTKKEAQAVETAIYTMSVILEQGLSKDDYLEISDSVDILILMKDKYYNNKRKRRVINYEIKRN